jgi:hypothetical protein
MNFIDYDKIDLGYPGPMGTPTSGTGVQPLGRHNQNPGIAVRCWKGGTRVPIVTSENADRNLFELASPLRDQFFCQCPQRRDINGAEAQFDRMKDRLLRQPCLPAAGGHLENAAESGRKKPMVDHLLLGGIQRLLKHWEQ